MKNRHLLLITATLLVWVILGVGGVSAVTYNYTQLEDTSTSGSANNDGAGWNITTNGNSVLIKNFTAYSNEASASISYANGTLVASAVFTGDVASFDTTLKPNTNYFFQTNGSDSPRYVNPATLGNSTGFYVWSTCSPDEPIGSCPSLANYNWELWKVEYEIVATTGATSLSLPTNGSIVASSKTNFTASYNMSAYLNHAWKNATYYIYNASGTEINKSTVTISGLTNQTMKELSGYEVNKDYLWNVEGCRGNATFTNCTYATTNYSFSWKPFTINSQTYSNTTTEGATETFTINLTMTEGYRVTTSYLNYNHTNYEASVTSDGTTYILRSITIPDITAEANITFFWILNTDVGIQTNTTGVNQTVYVLGIDNCTTYTAELFNISLYDEVNQQLLAAAGNQTSMRVSFTLTALNGTTQLLNYSHYFNQVNPARLCMQNALGGSRYRLDGVIEYSSLARFIEFYNFQNFTLTNTTSAIIKLYNLNNDSGNEFKVTYKDSNFVPVEGAILDIQRKYIDEGLFRTTERPKTGAEGYTIAHLVRNDVIYNIIVMKEGAILATFENIVANCQNPTLFSCEINLNSYGSSSFPTKFEEDDDITFNLLYNQTSRVISSLFTIPSGIASTIILNVSQFDALGNVSVCQDVLTSSGGLLSCTVPLSFGNSTVTAYLYKNNVEVGFAIIKLKQTSSDLYGGNLVLIAMLVFLVVLGIGATSDSPMTMGIIMVIGTILLIGLNLIYSPSIIGVGATVLWIVIAVAAILIKGSNRQ